MTGSQRPGWEPSMPRGPRCAKPLKVGGVCVRRENHPGDCWSAQRYRRQLEATGAWRARHGAQSLADFDPVRLLRWGPALLARKRAEWRSGITEPGAGRS